MTNSETNQSANPTPTTALAIKSKVEDFFLGTPGKKVFEECIWCVWDNEEVLVDICEDHENYGLCDLFKISQNVETPLKMAFCDTAVEYLSNGKRVIKQIPFMAVMNSDFLFWQERKHLRELTSRGFDHIGPYLVDMPKMKKAFRSQAPFFEMLEKKYPGVKWRFNVSADHSTFSLAMNLEGKINACRFSGCSLSDMSRMPFSSLSGLRKRFEAFALLCAQHSTDAIDTDERINSIDIFYDGKHKSVATYVGYADIPYDVAERSVKNISKLKDLLFNGAERFNVTISGNLIADTCNEFKFDEDFGCCVDKVMILPPEVYASWGQPWTPAELKMINRERKFPYFNPDFEEETRIKRLFSFIALPVLAAIFGMGDWAIFKTGLWENNNELSVALLAVSGLYLIFAVVMILRLIKKKH